MISQVTSVFQVKCFAMLPVLREKICILLFHSGGAHGQGDKHQKMSFKPEECSAGNFVYDKVDRSLVWLFLKASERSWWRIVEVSHRGFLLVSRRTKLSNFWELQVNYAEKCQIF